MKIIRYPKRDQWPAITARPHIDHSLLHNTVSTVLSDIRQRGDEAVLDNGDRLQISRPRKTAFMQQIADYYGNKKINMGRF